MLTPIQIASLERLEYAKRISGDIIDTYKTHICHPDVCNPENEPTLIAKGFLAGPATTRDLYLCRYRSHHLCTERYCNSVVMGVCPISGACYGPLGGYSSYDKNNARTWHSAFRDNEISSQTGVTANPNRYIKPEPETQSEVVPLKKARKPKSSATLQQYARQIIIKLLFSKTRASINTRHLRYGRKTATRKIRHYLNQCEQTRSIPSLLYILMIQEEGEDTNNQLEQLNYDQVILDKYTMIIWNIYEKISKYYPGTLKMQTMALAILYEMRQGYSVDGMIIIPSDTYLLYNLPLINDLPLFSLKKKEITIGQKIIKKAVGQALEQNIERKKLEYRI